MRLIPVAIAIPQLRRDALSGQVSALQLVDLIDKQQQTIQALRRENQRLQERLAPYEPEVGRNGSAPQPSAETPTQTPSLSYSLEAEAKRRRGKRHRRKKSPGRRPTELKFQDAHRTEDLYPEGYPEGIRPSACQLVRQRVVWRLEDGRAVRVGYRIFAAKGGSRDRSEPRIPGVTPRCEYGIEILVVLAFLVYIIGISLDKACMVLGFFCQLPLSKSQADALLRQLAQHWEGEFDHLCDLIAHAAVVYLDETGWKVGTTPCSLWTFAANWQRLFVFGCRKDDDTLDQILPPDVFEGTGVSDDYAVYRDRFRQAQKCWAHLLRKAIKFALLYPRKKSYQRFLDRLLALYYDAKRAAADKRLGEAGRQKRVEDLDCRLGELCRPIVDASNPDDLPHERDFANLATELIRLSLDQELFTFVLVPGVEATNNLSERLLRGAAQDRKAGRTNQTAAGAHRRSVIVSVLESLRAHLPSFNLTSVLQEVGRWLKDGISLFGRQWQAQQAQQAQLAPAMDTS